MIMKQGYSYTGNSVQAIGTIDAKFDCGYLISVKLGDETLKGVIYHPSSASSYTPLTPPQCKDMVQQESYVQRRTRQRRRRRNKVPNCPKPNRSGYNFFFQERHLMLKSLYPSKEREFTKMIGDAWNSLSADDRVVYQNYGLKDKERYQNELKGYKERVKINKQHR